MVHLVWINIICTKNIPIAHAVFHFVYLDALMLFLATAKIIQFVKYLLGNLKGLS